MEDTYRMDPHILRRVLDADREEVASVPIQNEAGTEAQPALLIFPNREEAAAIVGSWSSADHEPAPVSPEDIQGFARITAWYSWHFSGCSTPSTLKYSRLRQPPLSSGRSVSLSLLFRLLRIAGDIRAVLRGKLP